MDRRVVLMVGAQGAGKSTYCREHLPDYFRISQDEQGPHRHLAVYEEALARGEPRIVIDRINALKTQRRRYLDCARQHGYHTSIVWLNVDRTVCLERCLHRARHPTLEPAAAERALEHYFRNFQVPSRREADELEVIGHHPTYVPVVDLRARIGFRRHIILGDVHGCLDELQEMLRLLAFEPALDVLISVGDIVDRGPKIRETVEYLTALPEFHMVLGNHEDKLVRYLEGSRVKADGGLGTTIAAYADDFPADLKPWLAGLPLILHTPSGYVVHAGFDPEMPPEEQSRADCLYMRYHGGKSYFDEVNGRFWYTRWPVEGPRVFFGHIPDPCGPILEHVVSLDGGCVFGGELRAFDSRDGQVHRVKARQAHVRSGHWPPRVASPLEAIHRREEYIKAGLLRCDRTDDGQLAIYSYTDQCAYDNAWDEITRNSRGHIFDLQTGECVARPFPKFFNLGENEESRPELFPWDQPYEIYEKMDGWLGVLYRHEGEFRVASRGSFHSPGARWASDLARRLDFGCFPDAVTLCFEIIHPEHKVVVEYHERETLVVLAAFNRHTGEEYPRSLVSDWAREIGLPIVQQLGHLSFEDLLKSQKLQTGSEGFVIRFQDGRRVKVKTAWYLELARVIADVNPVAVWRAMRGGKVPREYLQSLPEELRPLAEKYRAVLEGQYARHWLEVEEFARPLLEEFGSQRKLLAMHLASRREELGYRFSAVFALLDNRPERIEKLIMEAIFPKGNRFVSGL